MKALLLDKKTESGSECYLIRVSLKEYITNIDSEYRDYDIQRGIVNNKYLDKLVDTIVSGKHIPVMVLITESMAKISESDSAIEIEAFKVLDGLQRTHRLLSIWETIKLIDENIDDIKSGSKTVRDFSQELKKFESNPSIFRKLKEYIELTNCSLIDLYSKNYVWLEVWTNLDRTKQIEKMLLLNAGHKNVNIKHQLELIFLNIIPTIKMIAPKNFSLLREKEISAMSYSKKRKVGEYFLPHIISALVSLVGGKPITTNNDFVHSITESDDDYFQLPEDFNLDLIKSFVSFLNKFDEEIYKRNGDKGTLWLGREVAIVGLFGAIGHLASQKNMSLSSYLEVASDKVVELVNKLNLPEFEKARNNVDLGKVNIGNVNKKAIFKAVVSILNKSNEKVDWNDLFGGDK